MREQKHAALLDSSQTVCAYMRRHARARARETHEILIARYFSRDVKA